MVQQRLDWKAHVDAIRRTLLAEWDPIGCGVPEDEYDSYIPGIYRLLQGQADVGRLAAHLGKLERISMRLRARPETNRRVAEKLMHVLEIRSDQPSKPG
jgi:hypothetical protein